MVVLGLLVLSVKPVSRVTLTFSPHLASPLSFLVRLVIPMNIRGALRYSMIERVRGYPRVPYGRRQKVMSIDSIDHVPTPLIIIISYRKSKKKEKRNLFNTMRCILSVEPKTL